MKTRHMRVIIAMILGHNLISMSWAQALDPRTIPNSDLDSNVTQGYNIRFKTRWSLWSLTPDLQSFGFKESISVGPFPAGGAQGEVGKIFDAGPLGDYGAKLAYGLRLGAGLKAEAGVDPDVGTVDVEYPMRVYIEYPSWQTLQPTNSITVHTRYYPGSTANMFSHFQPDRLPFGASVKYNTDLLAGITAQVAVGFDVLNFCLFGLPGFQCSGSKTEERTLFDIADFFQSDFSGDKEIVLPEPLRGFVTGHIHVPNLTVGRVGLGTSENPRALYSLASDNFLSLDANISSILSKTIIKVPLKDSINVGLGARAFYNILELSVGGGIRALQGLSFEPTPKITFQVHYKSSGRDLIVETRTIDAGENLTFSTKVPFAPDELDIVPFITPRHVFKNETSLRAGPHGTFLPLQLGVDLPAAANEFIPDLDLKPLGGPYQVTVPGADLELASYSTQFELPGVTDIQGTPYPITADTRPPKIYSVCPSPPSSGGCPPFSDLCPKTMRTQTTPRLVYFNARSLADSGFATVNSVRVPTYKTSECGFPFFQIPGEYMAQGGILRVQLVNPGEDRCDPLGCEFIPTKFSNTVDLTVLERVLPQDAFGPPELLQYSGIHQLDLSASPIGGLPSTEGFPEPRAEGFVAGDGLIWLSMHATSLESRIGSDSKLLWNGVPVLTDVQLTDSTETAEGTLYFYRLTAAVPSSLQTSGGEQRISFQNAGINAAEIPLSAPLTIRNPIPVITDAMVLTAPDAPSPGAKLFLGGSGFTEDSVAYWDGTPRSTSYQSASGLLAGLAPVDLAAGDHLITVVNPTPGGGTSNPFAHRTHGPIGLPFAAFQIKLDIRGDAFDENGVFDLGGSSNGIDPLTEPVSFTAWTFGTTIPAGSFKRTRKGECTFKGAIGGVTLEVKLTQRAASNWEFRAVGRGASLAGKGDPVFVTLTIGDDTGSTAAKADFIP